MNRNDFYYILGFGFLDFINRDGKVILSKSRRLSQLVEDISFAVQGNGNYERNRETVYLPIEGELGSFLMQHGVFTPKRYLPSIPEEFAWAFISGYFDGYGELSFKNDNTRISIMSPIDEVVDFISKFWKVRTPYADRVVANGYKALDILGSMYQHSQFKHKVKWNTYIELLNFSSDRPNVAKDRTFDYAKLHPSAVAPVKKRVTDSGFDLHIVEMDKLYTTPWGAQVYQGKTHLAIQPILGHAFDINGRSSLPKSGWVFLQGTGIDDRSYIGGIEGTFMRLKDDPLPAMPWRALQLVPREAPLHAELRSVKELGESDRGMGGFGSSN